MSLKNLIKEKNQAYRLRCQFRGQPEYAQYNDRFHALKSQVRFAIVDEKRKFFQRNRDAGEVIWRELGKLLRKRKQTKEPTMEPDVLNAHFAAQGLHGNEHTSPAVPSGGDSINPLLCRFEEITEDVVSFQLQKMAKRKKSAGPCGVPAKILGGISMCLTKPLTCMINASLKSGVYPAIFKNADVVAIPKQANARQPDDYRPISLACNLSKVFEKVVQNQLVTVLKRNNILSDKQSGFRKGHSCETLLLKVSERLRKAMDKGQVTAVCLLDLKKAFDSVSHAKLIEKLRMIGIEDNTLCMNEKKCKLMYICSEAKNSQPSPAVMINGHQMDVEQSVKYLGVYFDRNLKWGVHYDHVLRKVNYGIAMINRAKDGLDLPQRRSLYHACVQPHLDYGSV
ncbi:uncharacterized protein LOC129595621 [Paramacrobiotus metropolitanus]|uniref:uncharacterized protein LOC129595621 n=1 Tax=Paramacrobiotus metropolitanus TaxID=2943436 RepID=UPI0024456E87|nr:uncharacterized protein LOC129595621 [Paramacrobiotus metropolitanus]